MSTAWERGAADLKAVIAERARQAKASVDTLAAALQDRFHVPCANSPARDQRSFAWNGFHSFPPWQQRAASSAAAARRAEAPSGCRRRRARRRGPCFMSITATIAEEPKSVSFAGPGLVPKQGDKKGNSSAQAATDDSTENDPRMDDEVFISAVEVELVDEGGSHPMAAEIRQRTVAEVGLRPNFLHKIRDVKEDMERIFDLGWFSQVTPVTQDTRDGVKVTYEVRLLPEIKSVQMEGVSRLPASYLQSLFHDLPGQIMNWPVIVQKVKSINQWYSSNDLLGQVVDVNHDTASGQLRIKVGEATVDKLDLKFVSPNDPTKKRSRGMTRRDIIMRNVTTRPGQVYDKKQIERDLTAVEATGLFNSVSFVPSPTADCTDTNPRVHLDLEVEEKKMRGFSAGLGMSTLMQGLGVSPQGTIGNLALHHRNLFGCNQELKATMELGQQDRVFKVTHNDPWPRTNRNRTSRHVSVSNERTSGAPFFAKTHEQMAGEQNGPLHSSMTPRSPQGPPAAGPASGLGLAGDNGRDSAGSSSVVNIARLVGHLEWSMPLTDRISVNWGGSAWRARGLDAFGRVANRDDYGEVILYSSNADQDYAVQASAKAHYRGENVEAVVGVEQGLPMIPFQDCLVFSKVSGRAEGQVSLGLLQAVLAVKSGLLHGSCPPYLAFPLGGTNSIRGYTEGGVGTARRFVTATGELRVPLIPGQASPKPEEEEQGRPTHKKTPPLIQGTVFADIGTDFESGKDVVADPAGSRGKPGHGHGYGLGVRVQSPLGPLRLEYALNAMREGRFHVGIGFYG